MVRPGGNRHFLKWDSSENGNLRTLRRSRNHEATFFPRHSQITIGIASRIQPRNITRNQFAPSATQAAPQALPADSSAPRGQLISVPPVEGYGDSAVARVPGTSLAPAQPSP